MSNQALLAWHELCRAFAKLATKTLKVTAVNINSVSIRDEVKFVARQYMQQARPILLRRGFEAELAQLDDHFQKLYELAEGRNAATSYKWRINAIRKALPKITSRLEFDTASDDQKVVGSDVERQIAETVSALVPTAGLSYQQATRDLADAERISFRGPATELREVLREVLDHLAPDEDVKSTAGFRLEADQKRPTMKQKVRFILRARGQRGTASAASEKAAEAVDLMVGGIARSVYDLGSVVTHVAGERQTVVQLKRYVEAVLAHLLEL